MLDARRQIIRRPGSDRRRHDRCALEAPVVQGARRWPSNMRRRQGNWARHCGVTRVSRGWMNLAANRDWQARCLDHGVRSDPWGSNPRPRFVRERWPYRPVRIPHPASSFARRACSYFVRTQVRGGTLQSRYASAMGTRGGRATSDSPRSWTRWSRYGSASQSLLTIDQRSPTFNR